jgi:uncharacterized small protein (DUF1192 family)
MPQRRRSPLDASRRSADDQIMSNTPNDPMAMWRDFLGQWEKAANDYGGQLLQRPEAAEAMHKATTLGLQAQTAMHEGMAKMLSAANMPSKAEVEALGQRLGAIEASIARIEAALATTAPSPSAAPKPARTRKPAP